MEFDLHARLVEAKPRLEALQKVVDDHWGLEDLVYRFYHSSYKLYRAQELTRQIVDELHSVAPDRTLNSWFLQIVAEGTGKQFSLDVNKRWLQETRPIIEALMHAKYFLDMAVICAEDPEPPDVMRSGYASMLTLYGER